MSSDVAYLAMADELEGALVGLTPGTRLPSEHQLAADHGVSRITARAALQELERRHAVRRTRGSGTFVALRLPYGLRAGSLPSWSRVVRGAGHEAGYQIIEARRTRAPARVARHLLLARGQAVVRLERVGLIDGLPAAHQVMWFPSARFPDLADRLNHPVSTAEVLADHYGVATERWWIRADLRPVEADVADHLDLVGRPLAWRTETVNRATGEGQPTEYSNGWLRADCFAVYLEVGPSDGTAPPPLDRRGPDPEPDADPTDERTTP